LFCDRFQLGRVFLYSWHCEYDGKGNKSHNSACARAILSQPNLQPRGKRTGNQATTWMALYAAIVSTAALLLNFRAWYEKGVRLHLNLMPDAVLLGVDSSDDERNLMALDDVHSATLSDAGL
jgi:hypothetical protein